VPVWKKVDSFEVQAKCAAGLHWWSHACAFYRLRDGECWVYASDDEFDSPAWLRWHELLHCAGWDHD
jgi:hypothetical protein